MHVAEHHYADTIVESFEANMQQMKLHVIPWATHAAAPGSAAHVTRLARLTETIYMQAGLAFVH